MPIDQRPNGIDCPKWEPASPGAKRCLHYEDASHECAHPLIGGDACSEYVKLQARKAPAGLVAGAQVVGHIREPNGIGTPPPPPAAAGAQPAAGAGAGFMLEVFEAIKTGAQARAGVGAGSGSGSASHAGSGSNSNSGSNSGSASHAGSNSGSGSGSNSNSPRMHKVIAGAIELGLLPPPDFQPAKEIDPKSLDALEASVDRVVMCSPYMGGKEIVLCKEVDPNDARLQISFRDAATIRLLVDSFPGAQVVDIRRVGEEVPF